MSTIQMIIKKHRTQIIQLLPEVRVKVACVLFFIILPRCFFAQIYIGDDAILYSKTSFDIDNGDDYLAENKDSDTTSKIYISKGTFVHQLSENTNVQIIYIEQAPTPKEKLKKKLQTLPRQKEEKFLYNGNHQVYTYQYKSGTESNISIRKTENIKAVIGSSNANKKKVNLVSDFIDSTFLSFCSVQKNTKIRANSYFPKSWFLITFKSRPPPYSHI